MLAKVEIVPVKILVDAGLVGSEGDGLDGVAWLKNREVGEIVGEFFFVVADNPFRGNEILLPENWDDNVGRMPDAPSSPTQPSQTRDLEDSSPG
jgi:hypothetical protein